MKKQIRFITVVLMVIISMLALVISGCKPTTEVGSGTSTVSSGTNEVLIGGELDNKTIKVLGHYTLWDGYKESFEKNYDGKVEQIIVSIDELKQKLASLILASDPPDGFIYHSDFTSHFSGLIKQGLIDPFDEYIDLTDPIYEKTKDVTEGSMWNGKHYFLAQNIGIAEMTVYNTQMFEQMGLETPWELYKKGEWTWDAMEEAAELLAQDTDNDGEIDIYGCTIWGPEVMVGTTGTTFGDIIDGNSIKMNLKDDNLVRAMQYGFDFNKKNKYALAISTSWGPALQRDRLAMALVPSYTYQIAEVKALAKAGKLGMAPLPKAPGMEKNIARAAASGWLLPKGSKNPEGIVAFTKCMIYENDYNKERLEKSTQESRDLYFLSDENMLQIVELKKNQEYIHDWGKGIVHPYLWEFWKQEEPWTTYVEKIIPLIDDDIQQLIGG